MKKIITTGAVCFVLTACNGLPVVQSAVPQQSMEEIQMNRASIQAIYDRDHAQTRAERREDLRDLADYNAKSNTYHQVNDINYNANVKYNRN